MSSRTPPPPPPVYVLDLFPQVRSRLVSLLSTLADEAWLTPTVCGGWSVKDVALHLLGVNVANLSRRRDGYSDAITAFVPPGRDLADPAALVETVNRWNEAWVVGGRRISAPLLCELLTATGEALEAYYRTLDLSTLGGPVAWAGPDAAPVWLDIAREYTEQWTHVAQICDALDQPVADEPALFGPVVATFMRALPHTLRAVDAPDAAAVRVSVRGGAGGDWLAVREGSRWVLAVDDGRHAVAAVEMDEDTAWRLMTKGLDAATARHRVRLEGDEAIASVVLAMVAIIA